MWVGSTLDFRSKFFYLFNKSNIAAVNNRVTVERMRNITGLLRRRARFNSP